MKGRYYIKSGDPAIFVLSWMFSGITEGEMRGFGSGGGIEAGRGVVVFEFWGDWECM